MVRGLSTARGSQQELADAGAAGIHRTHIALLAQSRSGAVREIIATRDDVPFGVQAALSNDDAHEVRAAMAANPRAAISVMNHLAADSHHAVLFALASNPNSPREVAETLAGHRRADVRNAALRRLEMRQPAPVTMAADPDAHIPELRDRVVQALQAAPEARSWAFGEEIDYPGGHTLSRLAQHIAGSPLLSQSRGTHIISPANLRVATAS